MCPLRGLRFGRSGELKVMRVVAVTHKAADEMTSSAKHYRCAAFDEVTSLSAFLEFNLTRGSVRDEFEVCAASASPGLSHECICEGESLHGRSSYWEGSLRRLRGRFERT